MKKENIVKFKDKIKERPKDHFSNLSEEEQDEIYELASVFFDEKKLKQCFQSIGTFSSIDGYREEEMKNDNDVFYMLDDIIELADRTFKEELEYDVNFSKSFVNIINLQQELKKRNNELNKK